MVAIAVSVVALLAALATAAVASAAVPGGPNPGAPPPAAQQKAPLVPGAEQKAQPPPAPAHIPVPEIVKRAEEVTKLLRELEGLAEPRPAIDAI